MMKCEDYQRALGANPQATGAGGEAHLAACPDCRALRDQYLELDRRIKRALTVPVPELTLPATHTGATVHTLPPRRRLSTPAWFGLAATLALAAWLGLLLQRPDLSQIPLTEQIIAHMDHEAAARAVTSVAVSERTLNSVVSNDIAELDRDVGLITYARSCEINGRLVPHLVIQGRKGPVTLLLMPDEPVTTVTPVEGEAINGVILPHGSGSIAIIGNRDEALDEIERRVIDSVKWKT